MATLTLSRERLTALLTAWRNARDQKDAAAERCTMMCCLFGSLTPDTMENQRGQAVLQHLFLSQATVCDIAVLFSFDKFCVVHDASTQIELPAPADGYTFTALPLDAGADAALTQFLSGATVGLCQRELAIQGGDFASRVTAVVKAAVPAERTVEIAPLIGEFLFVKDDAALLCVEKAAGLCNAVFRRFARGLIEEEIQKAHPRTLSAIREELSKKLEMPNTVKGLENLETSQYSIASGLTPCVMHRGTFKAQIQATEASTQPLCGDVIVIRYGVKNSGYTAFFGRTLIVEAKAPTRAKEAYQFVYAVSEKVMELLRPGTRLSDVYSGAMRFAQSSNADLAARLPKSLGFATGLLVLETRGTISEKATAVVADGMTFVVRVTLEAVPDDAGGGAPFDVELSDTVTVRAGALQLNTKAARRLDEVLYDGGEQEEEQEAAAAAAAEAFEHTGTRDLQKITRQGQSAVPLMSRESARDARLRELLHELHAELLAAGGKKTAAAASEELRLHEIGRISYGDVIPFSNESAFPAQARAGGIFVHLESEVAFFPLCGGTAAFHVATISKADVKQEGEYTTFTVTFHSLQEANVAYRLNRTKIFLKELNYRATRDVFTEAKITIQNIHQRIKNRDSERRRTASSAGSAKLHLIPNALRLPQIKIRPTATTGRQNKDCVGNLELHQNGFRFSYIGGPPIDIIFDNVKHIIFQPAVNSIRVIYHLTLKKVIEIARKNVDEVQFVADVMESSEGVTGTRRSYEEEIAAEEREQLRVSETNKQFMRFAQAVEKISNIKTQIPVSNFSFEGVHSKGLTTFKANREVLWAISDRPPLTVRVMDVEVVSLERVIPGGSTFDMSLIFKDYNRTTLTITTIPRGSLEAIKDWCLASRLYYMESTVNPNWKAVLKTIMEDTDWNPWRPGAGWAVLNNDGDEEDEEDGDDSDDSDDSTYYEDEDEESDDTSSSFLEDEEESDSGSDGDEDSALSWDEMERRAEAQDRKRGYAGGDDDDDDGRPKKRPRTGAAQSAAPRAAPLPTRGKAPQSVSLSRAVPPPRRF